MTPRKIGIIAACVAAGMLLVQLAGYDWFLIQLGSFRFPLWTLVALYAALQLWAWRITKSKLALTDAEVAQWGGKLELATPLILRQYSAHRSMGDIAAAVDKGHGIPPHITLRYIIALAQHASLSADADGSRDEDPTSGSETTDSPAP